LNFVQSFVECKVSLADGISLPGMAGKLRGARCLKSETSQ
jgi:hypothetical protein